MYHPTLRTGAQRQLKKIGTADLVIGLPTYKNPHSAAHVARVIIDGIQQHYSHLKTVIINADAGHRATTRKAIAEQVTSTSNRANINLVTGRYHGSLGQGSATAALLDAALALDAQAIVIFESNTETITPNWVAGLAHLVLEGNADLVLPRYKWTSMASRGTLEDLLIFPLFRALWGKTVRRPAAPDFALSASLATALLDEDVWETDVAASGLPPWLTTYAILDDWKVVQSALGEKRTCDPSSPPTNGKSTSKHSFTILFHQMMSVALRMVYEYQHHWKQVTECYSLSTLTQFISAVELPPVPQQDPTPLLDDLASSWIEYRMLWKRILTPQNLKLLEKLASLPPDQFYFPADLWAKIVYDFAVVFNKGDCDPYQVIYALFPIYQGRLAAFGQEIAGLSLVGREGTIAAQAVEFEEARSYLKKRWQTYQPWTHDEIR